MPKAIGFVLSTLCLAREPWPCSTILGPSFPYPKSNGVIPAVTQGGNTLHWPFLETAFGQAFWAAQLQNLQPTVSWRGWGQLIYRAPRKTSVRFGFSAKRGFVFGKTVLWVRNWFHYSPSVWPTLIFVPSPRHSVAERAWSIIQGDALLETIK